MRISDWSSDVCSSDLCGRDQAMKTAPAGADAEEAHVLEEGREGGVAVGLQHNREDAARAREVPTPERVTGIVGQRRKEDTPNGGMRDRKSTRLNSSHSCAARMPSSAWKKKNKRPKKH